MSVPTEALQPTRMNVALVSARSRCGSLPVRRAAEFERLAEKLLQSRNEGIMDGSSIPPPDTSSETLKRFEDKLHYMSTDLGNRGMWRSTMAPPLYKLAWAMGFQLVPPRFATPQQLAAFQGTTWLAWLTTRSISMAAIWRS